MGDGLRLGILVALLVLAAFAAIAETVIDRITRVKAHHLAQDGKKSSRRLLQIIENPGPALNGVLLVKIGAQVASVVMATRLFLGRIQGVPELAAAAAMTIAIYIFGELAPRTFAVQRMDSTALTSARPVFFLARLVHPLSKVLLIVSNAAMVLLPGRGLPKGPFVTEDEIRHLVDVAEEEEEIEEEERELIHSIFEFGDTVVREVMVPRPDMVTIKAEATMAEALDTITAGGYSRIPAFEGDNDNIIGVLYAKDLLKQTQAAKKVSKVSALARAPLFVPELKKVSELLREMQQARVHMAIVVDEYGGTAGLVTIEDLLEEIVGEIVDEYDQEEPLVEPIDDQTIRVDAKMQIDEVNELLKVDLPHEEWDTVGGLVFGLTGRVPSQGEVVRYDGLEFRTERVSGRRIQKVVITRSPAGAGSPEPGE